MTYQIFHTTSGWYYDVLNDNGIEINTRAYFSTYDQAKLEAESELFDLLQQAA